MYPPFLSPRLAGLLMTMACIALAGCSKAETRRIATDAVKSSIRSACTSAGNCTIDCADGNPVPRGGKCAETP